jgi:hypothetical protein
MLIPCWANGRINSRNRQEAEETDAPLVEADRPAPIEPGRPGRQLEHRVGAPPPNEPARWHPPAQRDRPTAAVEEDEVEREAHAEGVNGATARDQQAAPSALAGQPAEAEQPRPRPARHPDLDPEDRSAGQAQQPLGGGESLGAASHLGASRTAAPLAPPRIA